jgi:hypothetical protein
MSIQSDLKVFYTQEKTVNMFTCIKKLKFNPAVSKLFRTEIRIMFALQFHIHAVFW